MDPLVEKKTEWNPLTMIEQIKEQEKIKEDLKKVKSNLDLAKNNLKLLRGKKNLVKEKPPCKISSVIIPPGNPKNYTEKEYKSDFYSKFKNSTFTKAEIDDLYKSIVDQLNPVFKPVTKKDKISPEPSESESSESESSESESEFSEPELKDEIFLEHLPESSDSESE